MKWTSKIALVICLICFGLSIANFWLHNDTISFIIWPSLVIAMGLNCLTFLSAEMKWQDRYFDKTNECLRWSWTLCMIEKRVRDMKLPEESKEELLEYIEKQSEEVRAHRKLEE